MNIRKPIVDHWTIVTSGKGLQVTKNNKNIWYAISFEKAWSFVQNQGTPGDEIIITVNGTLQTS